MESWLTVCHESDISTNVGVCALVKDEQVAIFNCNRTQKLYAISNYDPIGDANILSRGIIGSVKGQVCVASPLYKQHFDLVTGQCIEEPQLQIPVYSVRNSNGNIQVDVTV